MQGKKKMKIGSRIVALMGAIWIGMTKIAHALTPENLVNDIAPEDFVTTHTGTIYVIGESPWYEKIWLLVLIAILFVIGITVYWKKSKATKKTKVLLTLLFLTLIIVINLSIWRYIYYAG